MLPTKNSSEASIQSPRVISVIAAADVAPIIMKIASSFFLIPVKSAMAPRIGDAKAMNATEMVVMAPNRAVACAGSRSAAA
jgi:hypothetical protein